MPTLTDIFASDAFSCYSLTAAIQKMAPIKDIIGQLGIFREIPVPTTNIVIEESRGLRTLVPTTPRGGPGIPSRDSTRVATSFKVPHYQLDDTVLADDILNVRAFGSSEPAPAGEIIGRKLATMAQNVETTHEYMKHGALQGSLIYPDSSVDATLDLYTQFGLTNKATDEIAVDFLTGTATTDIAGTVVPAIRDGIELALGGTPYTGIVALCGRTFFRKLIGHAMIKGLYLQQVQQYNLAAVGSPPGSQGYMSFTLNGVTFIEYYNKVGTSSGEANDGTFQMDAEAKAFPIGADIFHGYVAPADIVEAAGTLGQIMYARQWLTPNGKAANLEVQSNVLYICTRPKALIHCHTST